MVSPRILIVEDESIVADDIKETLISFGYKVVGIVASGEIAVERARELKPEIILMDIYLAGKMNGVEAAEQIHRFSDIPVIYLTAYADTKLLASAKLTHPYGYILKPYAEREVQAAIEIALYTHDTNQKLKESEERLVDFFENASDLIQTVNPDGSFIYVNQSWLKTLGYSIQELKNLTLFSIIHPDSQVHCRDIFNRVIGGETVDGIEAKFICKDGTVIDVEGNASCRFANGKPVATRAIFRNITERRKWEKTIRDSEESFRGLFNTVKEAIFVVDIKGNFLEVNEGALEMFGQSRTSLLGNSCEVLFAPGTFDTSQISHRLERAFHFASQNFEISACRSNGDLFFAECHLYHGFYFGKDVVIALVIDISVRKQMEDALRLANKKLNMLSSITRHDILNQIMVLRMYLELSREKVTDPELLNFINKEDEGIKTIAKQIEFTRSYENIGMHAPHWQDISKIIQSAKAQLTGIQHIDVAVDVPPMEVFADALIEKVFFNLMENSLRHGEHVTRIVFSLRKTENEAVIVYEDNGVGISQEDKRRLFEKGFGKNTGLGLFLSREILSFTGISLTENGQPGAGVHFEITIPAKRYRMTPGTE